MQYQKEEGAIQQVGTELCLLVGNLNLLLDTVSLLPMMAKSILLIQAVNNPTITAMGVEIGFKNQARMQTGRSQRRRNSLRQIQATR
jgi:hypothetical protein